MKHSRQFDKLSTLLALVILLTIPPIANADNLQFDDNSINIETKNSNSSLQNNNEINKKPLPIVKGGGILEHNTTLTGSIKINNSQLVFSDVAPTDPLIRETNVSFTLNAPGLLQITGNEPKSQSGDEIPATTCDDGSCSQTEASLWKQTLTYGFGFKCEANNLACSDIFPEDNYMDLGQDQPFQLKFNNGQRTVNLLYKLNLSNTQKLGVYKGNSDILLIPEL